MGVAEEGEREDEGEKGVGCILGVWMMGFVVSGPAVAIAW